VYGGKVKAILKSRKELRSNNEEESSKDKEVSPKAEEVSAPRGELVKVTLVSKEAKR
jgi:hypothetical protein